MCQYGFYTNFYTMHEYDSTLTVLLHKVVNTVSNATLLYTLNVKKKRQ